MHQIDSISRKEERSRRARLNSIAPTTTPARLNARYMSATNRSVRRLPYTTVHNIAHNDSCRTLRCTRRLDRRIPCIPPSTVMKSALFYKTAIGLNDKMATLHSVAITAQGVNGRKRRIRSPTRDECNTAKYRDCRTRSAPVRYGKYRTRRTTSTW